MSEVRVNNIVDYGGKGAPTFDNGAVISGISSLGNQAKIGSNVTITSGGINVSGVTTAATLSGNLTGDVSAGFLTATSTVIGSGVTINAGGLNITGVMTATTFEGSGASMTGVAMTITPMAYNPDVSDSTVPKATGIGITFDHRILAGSGNVTLSIANAGVAGTVVENFGVGSSVTIQGRKAIIDPTSDLNSGETYHINYPSGAFTNTSGDVSYVGTAYTFGVKPLLYNYWTWGSNDQGKLGLNNATHYSSPVQLPGTWNKIYDTMPWASQFVAAAKTPGSLWMWGDNEAGELGQNNIIDYSSPVQVPGTTWATAIVGYTGTAAIKTDGKLWVWGDNTNGALGQNQAPAQLAKVSSPVQIPGTTWDYSADEKLSAGLWMHSAIKTDGTLWTWGYNADGQLGDNTVVERSSPTQIPGTTWKGVWSTAWFSLATRTDGTLWAWGPNNGGNLGLNNPNTDKRSSPAQIPGTTWSMATNGKYTSLALRTDGTLWSWGENQLGELGLNQTHNLTLSSPTQIPGTTWNYVQGGHRMVVATKTDGTMWLWGDNEYGGLGQNSVVQYSSPTQIPGTDWLQQPKITSESVNILKEA